MKKFVIERKIDGVGRLNDRELSGAAATSNKALAQLAPKVQWVHSYVVADRTFCIYLADGIRAVENVASSARDARRAALGLLIPTLRSV